MQLVTFEHQGVQRVGLIERERVIDVNRAYVALLTQRGDPRARALADALVPSDMIGLLEAGERALEAIREVEAYVQEGGGSSRRTEGPRRDGIVFTLSEVVLKAPIPHPGKLILLGLNYRDHAEETGQKIPEVPTLFAKYTIVWSALVQPFVSHVRRSRSTMKRNSLSSSGAGATISPASVPWITSRAIPSSTMSAPVIINSRPPNGWWARRLTRIAPWDRPSSSRMRSPTHTTSTSASASREKSCNGPIPGNSFSRSQRPWSTWRNHDAGAG